jgi:hypothetical protein
VSKIDTRYKDLIPDFAPKWDKMKIKEAIDHYKILSKINENFNYVHSVIDL